MNCLSPFHSSQVSRLSDDRQHTAVRSAPRWSLPVGSVISLHRLEVETLRPRAGWRVGIDRFLWSMKMMYGSPVARRVSTSFWNSERASTEERTLPSFGDFNSNSAP